MTDHLFKGWLLENRERLVWAHISQHQATQHLRKELTRIAKAATAANAFLFDVDGRLWCKAHRISWHDERRLFDGVDDALLSSPMRFGRTSCIDAFVDGPHVLHLRSFVPMWLAVLLFDDPPNLFAVRSVVRASLPELEAAVVALPPYGGPIVC